MRCQVLLATALAFFVTVPAWPQDAAGAGKNVPLYHVTVIERTVRAVNYQYRSGPTQIDFKGTVLLPPAKGEATVQSKAGRTEIDARFEHLTSPQKFGVGYLTYVLWAVSPEGHAKNLGELIPGGSDQAKLKVTTDLQAFGLIVTAEPYSAVRQPSDVVVAENQIRPDTIGKSEPIEAKYELLPRGRYTYTLPDDAQAVLSGPKVSMSRYESTLELYQAQNAIQIARSLGADRYAPEVMQKAAALLSSAQGLNARKANRSDIVMAAREAAQTAEDARLIALDRQRTEELATAKEQAAAQTEALQAAQRQTVAQNEALRAAQAEARIAQADRLADQQLLEQERAARQRAEAQAAANAQPAPPPPPPAIARRVEPSSLTTPEKKDLRALMLMQLGQSLPTLDTPRGLTVTVSDADFRGAALKPSMDASFTRVAAVLIAHPGLTVDVKGHTDSGSEAAQERLWYERAVAVRDALVRNGVPAQSIAVHGAGGERPVATNATTTGREQNRRVEIVLSGAPIGAMASWDNTYSPIPRR
jgi:outer membrane protein OmpA-like peptidoglycan-associated protein